jgi:hypothetical protein
VGEHLVVPQGLEGALNRHCRKVENGSGDQHQAEPALAKIFESNGCNPPIRETGKRLRPDQHWGFRIFHETEGVGVILFWQ